MTATTATGFADQRTATSSVFLAAAGLGAAAGAAAGLLCSAVAVRYSRRGLVAWYSDAMRRALPRHVILVRHGESQANADHTLRRERADNLIELTALGSTQASAVGERIRRVVGAHRLVNQWVGVVSSEATHEHREVTLQHIPLRDANPAEGQLVFEAIDNFGQRESRRGATVHACLDGKYAASSLAQCLPVSIPGD